EMTSLTPRGPPPRELAQERAPERLGLGGADIEAENLTPAVAIDSDRDDDINRHDAPVLPHLHVGRIDPQIRPVSLDRPLQERVDAAVDLLAQPAHLALEMRLIPIALHQLVDRAGRDTLHVDLLHYCGERLFGHATRLQE